MYPKTETFEICNSSEKNHLLGSIIMTKFNSTSASVIIKTTDIDFAEISKIGANWVGKSIKRNQKWTFIENTPRSQESHDSGKFPKQISFLHYTLKNPAGGDGPDEGTGTAGGN